MSDSDGLRRLFHERRSGAVSVGDCPAAERIWLAALDRSSPADFREVLEHTAACPACAAAWRLARDFGKVESRPIVSRGRWQRWAPLAAAAAVVAAIGVLLVSPWQAPPGGDSPFRAGRSVQIESRLGDEQSLPRDACTLRWSFDAEGASFAIRVLDEDLNLLISEDHLDTTQFRVPEEVLRAVPSEGSILWQIDAVLPDGQRQRSATFSVRVE